MRYTLKSFIRRALNRNASTASDGSLFDEKAWAKLQRDLDIAFGKLDA